MAAFAALAVPAAAFALDVPPLQARVNDLAGALGPGDRARIEAKLEAYERQTGHQFAVLIVPSLQGDPIEDFTIRVVERWKLGAKGRDDGVLLLVVPNDRKMRIEVGYGLEGAIPDAIASRVIRDVIAPRFRTGDTAGGIEAGLDVLMRGAAGESIAEHLPPPTQRVKRNPVGSGFGFLLMMLFLGRWLLGRVPRVGRGLLLGGIGAALGYLFLSSAAIAVLLAFLGFFVGLLSGGGGGFWHHAGYSSWGGGFGGGGFGGGGGGGGGFSGGGGGFGGGGASGDW